MAPYNSDVLVRGIRALELRDKPASAHHIKSCDTEKALGVVGPFGLEDLGTDGHSAVDRIRYHKDVCVRGGVCDGFGEVTDDGRVGVEEVYRLRLSGDIAGIGKPRLGGLEQGDLPSRVMPGFRGTPAGMRTISAPVRACFRPSASGW